MPRWWPRRRRALGVGSVVAGRYELAALLGEGGMGSVYLARDLTLKRMVAVKVLHHDAATSPDAVARFEREGEALARLNHPNIITLYDTVRRDGRVFLVLERVEGSSLATMVAHGPLPWRECRSIGLQVCAALSAAHAAGVIHRDITPGNILITRDGVAKVADFGVARLAGPGNETQAGLAIGTPQYFSPEQAQGLPVYPASDVYALSVVMFEAATGRPPFVGEDARALAAQHIASPPPDPSTLVPTLPAAACEAIVDGLSKEPVLRPSLAEFRDALFEAGEGAPLEPRPAPVKVALATRVDRTMPPPPTITDAPRRARALPLVALLMAVAGTAAGAVAARQASPGLSFAQSAAVPGAAVEVPAGWAPTAVDLPGWDLGQARAMGPEEGGGGIAVGVSAMRPTDAAPAAAREVWTFRPATGRRVRVAGVVGIEHSGARIDADGTLVSARVVTVPRAGGSAIAACWWDAQRATVRDGCDAALRGLRVENAASLPPNPAYAARVSAVLDALRADRDRAWRAAARASTPAQQAARLQQLAAAYQRASTRLTELSPDPAEQGPHGRAVAAANGAATAAQSAAAAVRSGRATRFAAAQRALAAADARVRDARRQLGGVGYTLTGG